MHKHEREVQRLMEPAGTTYADEAGIRINDTPYWHPNGAR
jgi:hypothetical protein